MLFLSVFLLTSVDLIAAERNYDQRIKRLERLLKNQDLLEMLMQLQALRREVSQLRGDMEVMTHNLGEIKKQQKNIYLDLDQRLSQLDQKINTAVLAVDSQTAENSLNAPAAVSQGLGEQEEYQAALALLKENRYQDAIAAFQIYLVTYPASEFAPNAQYWMAEAYYVLKDYQAAIAQFNKVISAYPGNRKIPDAYLKIGFSYYELKDWPKATQALAKVLANYAGTPAARLAKIRLQKMKREGRS